MGFFGPSKKDRENAEYWTAEAKRNADEAKRNRAKAARVRDEERTSPYKDPQASRAIAEQYDAHARVAAENARDMRIMARELTKPWWKR